ncbi:MAG TPA: NERD domain-containing protein [Thiobacillaceae bacterium]|nr:NERD domain-containing protein [Thiobacillaceae bacterium]
MILKTIDDKATSVAELEGLLASAPSIHKPKLEQELRALRAGMKGEQESAYLIDFDYRESKNNVVIHDLRLEINGRVAQIDHLLINRMLDALVLETKHFHAGIKITEEGEFLRWNDFRKCYEGMASPLAQNERHIQVLRDAFAQIDMPTRLGVKVLLTFHSFILVAPNARIDRPKKFDTSKVIKADALRSTWEKELDETSVLGAVSGLAKLVSTETLVAIGRQLVTLHRPASVNYASKFGIVSGCAENLSQQRSPQLADSAMSAAAIPEPRGHVCRACGSARLTIQYGKYGYYFKCSDCGGNTPVKLGCGGEGHKERLRKEGRKFFRECADCRTSKLYFENPE